MKNRLLSHTLPRLLLFVGFVLSSCTVPAVHPPEITLIDLDVDQINLLETSFRAKIRLDNENSQTLTLTGGVHRLYINDIYIGKGLSDQEVQLERLTSTVQGVIFRMDNLQVLAHVRELVSKGNFRYRIESILYGTGALGQRRFEIIRDGTVRLTAPVAPAPEFSG